SGIAWHIRDCWFLRPKNRGITSHGTGCFSMSINNCEWLSIEYEVLAQDRVTIGFNTNNNDVKVRNNRCVRYRHFAVMNGSGHIITGNHFWQGDSAPAGDRTAGIVLTAKNSKTVMSANYIDNCFIEVSNEHATLANASPGTEPFGTLSMTGNIFTVSSVPAWFTYLRFAPQGNNYRIDGVSIIGNTFKSFGGVVIDRVEEEDTSNGSFDHSQSTNVIFQGNSFEDVASRTENPSFVEIDQSVATTSWNLSNAEKIPFGGQVLGVSGWAALGPIQDAGNVDQFETPYFTVAQGALGDEVDINWAGPRKGKIQMQLRSDLAA
ncbi:MAG: right-handed parallel beta-helix repeat-containing protein, partial [Rhodobacteraceae bacterium]|nr:right-handed parallel beta-helix repeat-containing protein [Paracoccaceae bacterium]